VRPRRIAAVIVGCARAEQERMEPMRAPDVVQPSPDAPGASARSWLCRDEFERLRLLDMEERVRPVRQRAFAILAVSIGVGSPWLGWWPLLFILPATLVFLAATALMPRIARPENAMFGAWVLSGVIIAAALAIAGEPAIPALAWLAIPVITLSARFSTRGVIAGVLTMLVLLVAVVVAVDGHAFMHNPTVLFAPFTVVICVAVLSTPLMHSDIQHRSDAVIDQLTGMLNRKALGTRVQELAEQSELTGEPVGIVIGDLDHFKAVNDTHGHTVGDAVLREVAYVMRKQLRAFDLAYRLGGEEFLILLPGSSLEQAGALAERLREAVAREQLSSGESVTMSFGVGASDQGGPFDYATVFIQADAELYRAKRAGRNRVSIAEQHPHAQAVAAMPSELGVAALV
jgi:diguanylate cyclase (GGDEF)-like protein